MWISSFHFHALYITNVFHIGTTPRYSELSVLCLNNMHLCSHSALDFSFKAQNQYLIPSLVNHSLSTLLSNHIVEITSIILPGLFWIYLYLLALLVCYLLEDFCIVFSSLQLSFSGTEGIAEFFFRMKTDIIFIFLFPI